MASRLGSGQARNSLYWERPAWVENLGDWIGNGSTQPGEELVWAPPHHFPCPPPSPLNSVEILCSQRGARPEEGGKRGRQDQHQDRCCLAGSRWGVCVWGVYLVRAMTMFFLGCWITGLPMLPFFREPFRASSRCFSAGEYGKEAVSCPQDHPTLLLRVA